MDIAKLNLHSSKILAGKYHKLPTHNRINHTILSSQKPGCNVSVRTHFELDSDNWKAVVIKYPLTIILLVLTRSISGRCWPPREYSKGLTWKNTCQVVVATFLR